MSCIAKINNECITVTPGPGPHDLGQAVLLGFCSSHPLSEPGWHRGVLMALKELADGEGMGTQVVF